MILASTGVGACGLKAVEWGGARKALRRLGAVDDGVTAKHKNVAMRLPTGVSVELGKAVELRGRAHRGRVGALLAQLEAGGLPALLFVAALEVAGGAVWQHRPAEVDRMRQVLRHWPGRTTDEASWRAIMAAYHQRG
jgi:hypothetical protein